MKGKLRLACDIDGCVCNLAGSMLRYAERNHLQIDQRRYPWFSEEFFLKNPEIYADADAVEGAAEKLSYLSHGYEICFVTSRPEEAKDITRQWLNEKGMSYPVVHFKGEKGLFAREHELDLAIEDSPQHILSYERAGIPVLRCDQPYNRHLKTPLMIW